MREDNRKIAYLYAWVEAFREAGKVVDARMKEQAKPKKKKTRKPRRNRNA